MEEFASLDAVAAAARVASGDVSAAEMVSAALARARQLDQLGACVTLFDERALDRAATATGPFAGVPMLLKDAGQELAGTPYRMGCQALADIDYRSTTTTTLAARFEALGFVIIGKAAVPELMTGITTEPPIGPPARNPWDQRWTVGGSSGGSAAAVAAGIVAIAHGSDSTGSLRYPASCCAVLTLKPTAGRIPSRLAAGLTNPNSYHADFVLGRSVRDLRVLLDLLSNPDATSGPVVGDGQRVGILSAMPFGLSIDRSVRAALDQVAGELADRGSDLVEVSPARLEAYGVQMGGVASVLIDRSRADAVAWIEAQLGRPVRAGDLSEEVLEAAERGRAQSAGAADEAWELVFASAAEAAAWSGEVDVLLLPVLDRPPWPIGEPVGDAALPGLLCSLASFTGQPAAVVPTVQQGRPVGLQLVGPHGADELLLDAVAGLVPTAPESPLLTAS